MSERSLRMMTLERWLLLRPSTQKKYLQDSARYSDDPLYKLLGDRVYEFGRPMKKEPQTAQKQHKNEASQTANNRESSDDKQSTGEKNIDEDENSPNLAKAVKESELHHAKIKAQLRSEVNRLNADIESLKLELSETRRRLERRVTSLEENSAMDKQKIEELHEKLAKVQGEVDTLKKNEQIFKEVKDILLQLADKNTKGSAFYQKIDQLVAVGERIAASETSS